jgi:hypothetical protein
MLGVGKESGTVCRFKARKSMVQRTVPSFFITRTNALAEGAMMPSAVQSASCFFRIYLYWCEGSGSLSYGFGTWFQFNAEGVHIIGDSYLSGLIREYRFPPSDDFSYSLSPFGLVLTPEKKPILQVEFCAQCLLFC